MAIDPKAFGQRIKEAMEEGRWELKALHEELRNRTGGAKGTSYGAVWAYANGDGPAEPRPNVVDALAAILNRTPRYLLYGVEPKSIAHAAEVAAAGPPRGTSMLEHIAETVSAGLREGASRLMMPGSRQTTAVHTYTTIMRSSIGDALFHDRDRGSVGEALGRAMRAPLDELGVQLSDVSERALTEYFILVSAAIRQLAESPAPPSSTIRRREASDA